jgi:predicted ATPase/class 3 adenylate cyclase
MTELRALLLTDVVDSTKLSEAIGDRAMAAVWAAHDRVARDLLPQWRGREIDKTDGMLLMFDTAADGACYALQYHRALADMAVPLKARAGLHVGPVILRENSAEDVARGAKPLEVDGLAKPTAARVMSLARGGQTLLTPEARDALGETDLQTQSHGHWMIKGVSAPVELFEVGTDPARFAAPPDSEKVYRVVESGGRWLPVTEIANNLPQQGTSFIGREREIDEVKAMLGDTRLVTLLGMGGLGKTRLSLQVAAEQMALFPDGVWFLDLSPLRDAALVVSDAARVLSVPEEPGRPLLQALCSHLKSKSVLLVLDNCEHLIKPAADMAHAIVKAAPNVRMIASSREPLHVPGEKTYPILPLAVPERNASLQVLQATPSVQLFVQRARAHKPAFELNEREAPAVAELVARLEGIPLALELAAARVRAMSVADINKRLNDRYKILTGGSRVLQERQQTLRALVDWSYELLNQNEQLLLRRLAIFIGGFDLQSAEKICGVEPLEDFEVLDLLGSLVDKSLAMLEEREEGSRYRMLETIRDYAAEKLQQDSDAAAAAAVGHCHYFFEMAKDSCDAVGRAEQGIWIRRVEDELDNIRSAMKLAMSGGVESVIAVKFCVALLGFWTLRGYASEGRGLVKAALELPEIDASDLAKAHALYVGAGLAEAQSDHVEACRMLESCLELRRGLGRPAEIAATLSTLSIARLRGGAAAAASAAELEALNIFRELGERVDEGIALLHLGQIGHYIGDDGQATTYVQQSLKLAQEIDNPELEGECHLMLGKCAFDAQDHDAAARHLSSSLEVCTRAADKRGEANALWWLGKIDLAQDKLESARRHLGAAVGPFRSFEMWDELLGCLEDFALLMTREGAAAPAVQVSAWSSKIRQRLNLARAPRVEARWQSHLTRLREGLTEAAYAAEWQRGWDQLEADDAVRLSLSGR